jgi:hypothetical protein
MMSHSKPSSNSKPSSSSPSANASTSKTATPLRFSPNKLALAGPTKWIEQMDADKAKALEAGVNGDEDIDYINDSGMRPVSSVKTGLERTKTDEKATVKFLAEAMIKLERENQTLERVVFNNTLKITAALDLAADNKVELQDVRRVAVD